MNEWLATQILNMQGSGSRAITLIPEVCRGFEITVISQCVNNS